MKEQGGVVSILRHQCWYRLAHCVLACIMVRIDLNRLAEQTFTIHTVHIDEDAEDDLGIGRPAVWMNGRLEISQARSITTSGRILQTLLSHAAHGRRGFGWYYEHSGQSLTRARP